MKKIFICLLSGVSLYGSEEESTWVKTELNNDRRLVYSQVLHKDADEKESLVCSLNKQDKSYQCWRHLEAFGKSLSTPLSVAESKQEFTRLADKDRKETREALVVGGIILAAGSILLLAEAQKRERKRSLTHSS